MKTIPAKFTIRANFNASPAEVYKAWSTQEGLESWFLRRAEFVSPTGKKRRRTENIKAQDSYTWMWHGFPDKMCEKKKILIANDKDLLRFIFSGDCVVTISIYRKKGVTLLDLIQDNIPEEKNLKKSLYVQCQTGWTFYLANLKSILEGGIDLRNKRLDLDTNFK